MASRYERIFLLQNIQNKPDADVILVAGGLLYDNLTGEKKLQLKLKVVDNCVSDVLYVYVQFMDAEGNEITSTRVMYNDGPYTQGMEFGKDTLVDVDIRTASFTASVDHVYYEDDVNLFIKYQTPKSFFRPRVPALQFHIDNFHDDGEWFTLEDGQDCADSHHRGNFSMVLRNSETGKETKLEFVHTKDTALNIAYNKKTGLFDITMEDLSDKGIVVCV